MLQRGGSINPSAFPDEEFELYSIPAHDAGGHEICLGSEIGSAKQVVQSGDVMLSKIVPHIRRAAIVGDPQRRQIASGEWIVFRGASFHPNYLRQYLLSDDFHAQFLNTVAGVGGSLLRARPELVKRIEINLPSVTEQRRIAAILDQADSLRTKRRQVLAHLDSLTQSIFHDMFGAIGASTYKPLSALATVTSGITKGRRTSEPTFATPYLAVSNVQAGRLVMNTVKEIPATEAEIERYALADGDLVLTEGGDPDKLGRGTVWRNELPLCLHQNHVFRVRINDSCELLPDFLAGFLSDSRAKRHFLRSAKQTTGIASINMTQLKALPVPVPSLPNQDEYLQRMQGTRHQIGIARRGLASMDNLFSSLQSRAFRGEL
ncbi:restriction endonuclease subunit S [Ammonicoccus fulvus]|uniref:Restriction endonuclease subunit S n=1 Tax=Ammonicoccus fulvus TaxID=3138240 RepID=A0ABZ3FJP4_9ACTN